jgi:hypothetical protein
MSFAFTSPRRRHDNHDMMIGRTHRHEASNCPVCAIEKIDEFPVTAYDSGKRLSSIKRQDTLVNALVSATGISYGMGELELDSSVNLQQYLHCPTDTFYQAAKMGVRT